MCVVSSLLLFGPNGDVSVLDVRINLAVLGAVGFFVGAFVIVLLGLRSLHSPDARGGVMWLLGMVAATAALFPGGLFLNGRYPAFLPSIMAILKPEAVTGRKGETGSDPAAPKASDGAQSQTPVVQSPQFPPKPLPSPPRDIVFVAAGKGPMDEDVARELRWRLGELGYQVSFDTSRRTVVLQVSRQEELTLDPGSSFQNNCIVWLSASATWPADTSKIISEVAKGQAKASNVDDAKAAARHAAIEEMLNRLKGVLAK